MYEQDTLMIAPVSDNTRVMVLASGDLWAGAEAVVYELCTGLKKHTPAEVTAVFLNEGILAGRCRDAGITTHVIDEESNHFAAVARQVIRLVRTTQPDVIHAHRYKENMLAFLVKVFTGKTRLVSTVHGRFEHPDSVKQKVLNRLNAYVLGHAFSSVVAVSRDLKCYLERQGIPDVRIRCIVNGIGAGGKVRTDIMEREEIAIGSAGRLFPVKDYPLMVDAAEELCRRNGNVRFILAGDGPDMRQLREKIRGYGIDGKFQLLGHVQNMESFYRSIDIYLNTSQHEGTPMTVLEAMSYGIPVVGADVGGLREVVSSGVSGYLVKERTGRAFADALLRLLDDRQSARSMGINARQRIEREYSSRKMVQDYYALYSSLA